MLLLSNSIDILVLMGSEKCWGGSCSDLCTEKSKNPQLTSDLVVLGLQESSERNKSRMGRSWRWKITSSSVTITEKGRNKKQGVIRSEHFTSFVTIQHII